MITLTNNVSCMSCQKSIPSQKKDLGVQLNNYVQDIQFQWVQNPFIRKLLVISNQFMNLLNRYHFENIMAKQSKVKPFILGSL